MKALLQFRLYLSVIMIIICPHLCTSQIINTIAGNGTAGFSGDGAAATLASINNAGHVAIDASGNIFITDYNNNRIRKVNPAGIISTFAGTGVAGYSGDGGPAISARLNHPNVIAFDALGNIYFGDANNNVIRKISTSGIITTVAGTGVAGYSGDGGPAIAAKLGYLPSVVVDPSGNLIILDYSNNRVRKVDGAGIITTIVGTGIPGFSGDGGPAIAAKIHQPVYVTFDAAGNYYVVDQLNNRIRKVTTSGNISTVVGSGSTPGYSGDGGPATAALLHFPAAIAIDASGNMLICDAYNNVVRKVNTGGVISTFAGTGVTGYGGDGGPAIAATFNQCTGVTFDASGNIFISDFFNNRIREIVIGNHNPYFDSGNAPALYVCENAGPTPINSLLSISDTDIGQTETWTSILPPANGTLSGFAVTASSTGSTITPLGLTYTPLTGYSGSDSFKVAVSDGIASDTITIHITVTPLPNAGVISGPTNVCVSSSISLTNTATGGAWTSGSPSVANAGGGSGIVTGLTAGVTVITYSVTNLCGTATDTQNIVVNPLPNAGLISGPISVCVGSSISLTNTVTGGAWTSGSPSVANIGSSSGVVTGLTAGTTTISYSITNSCGTAVDTQNIVVLPLPNAGLISGPISVCVGSSISLTNTAAGGTWSSGSPSVANVGGSSGIVTGLTSGTAIISYSVTNSCGTAADTQNIAINSLPVAGTIAGPTNLCEGATISLSNTATSGVWNSSSTSTATITATGVLSGVTAGTCVISYSVTNICGTATDTQSVTVNALPNPGSITAPSSTLCHGSSVTLTNTITGGTWSSSNTSAATIDGVSGLASALSPGITTITYTTAPSATGCISATTFVLTVIADVALINSTVNELKCYGDHNGSINLSVLTGSGSYQYTWSNGNTTTSLTGLAAGSYSVIVKDLGTNCSDTQNFNLIMPQPIGITSTIKNAQCNSANGEISLVNISGGTSPFTYLWSTGATTTSISALSPGDFTVNITDNNQCASTFTLTVKEDSCYNINVHNVITPNGDGINDLWVIEGLSKYPGNSVQLFDKWGDIVFDKQSYNNDWGGGSLPDGTYFYLIKLNNPAMAGEANVMKGSLLIKR